MSFCTLRKQAFWGTLFIQTNSKGRTIWFCLCVLARPKRFELPFSGIGIRCVIQLRHGRMSYQYYTLFIRFAQALREKQYHKIDDVIDAQQGIERCREADHAVDRAGIFISEL